MQLAVAHTLQPATLSPPFLQDFADRVGREAARRGWAPVVLPADGYAVAGLPDESAAIFVVATAGQVRRDKNKGRARFFLFPILNLGPPPHLFLFVFLLG